MLKKVSGFAFREFIFGGHLQSLGSAGLVFISANLIFNTEASFGLLLVTYCIFQFIYTHDRYKHFVYDVETNSERSRHFEKYLNKMPLLLLMYASVILLGNLYFSNKLSLILSFVVVVFGVAYTLYFKQLTRKVFLLKNIYVSLVFSVILFFPLIFYGLQMSNHSQFLLLIIFVFFESMITQMALDIKDFKKDRKEGLLTLPVVVGKDTSISLLRILSIFFGLSIFLIGYMIGFNFVFLSLTAINILVNQLFLKMIFDGNWRGYVLGAAKFSIWFLITAFLF
ncbi:MAG: UbiA family prenyltransferase [Candidatus Woesebacteria bacterium]|jgi:4-hydroxybenzoate polyprenyltransferase